MRKTQNGFPIKTVGNDNVRKIGLGTLAKARTLPLGTRQVNRPQLSRIKNTPKYLEPLAIFSWNSQLGIKKVLVTEVQAFNDAANFFNVFKGSLIGSISYFK